MAPLRLLIKNWLESAMATREQIQSKDTEAARKKTNAQRTQIYRLFPLSSHYKNHTNNQSYVQDKQSSTWESVVDRDLTSTIDMIQKVHATFTT